MHSRHHLFNYHRGLLADRARTEAFQRAITAVVKPGHVVVDVGCGSGILSFLACAAGARRVYSIERGDVIEVARALAHANGLADRIVFLEGSSKEVAVPERADLLVGEILGNSGLEENILGFFIDARERFLTPTGTSIPRAIEIQAAAVCVPDAHARMVGAWDRVYGLDFTSMRQWAAQQTYPLEIKESEVRTETATLATLDLMTAASPFVTGEVTFQLTESTTLHGFAVWFRAELAPGVFLTNAPPLETRSWNHLFLPLESPLILEAGERIRVAISTHDGLVWRWRGETLSDEPRLKGRFDHSTFAGFPVRRKALLPLLDSAVSLSAPHAAAGLFVLQAFGNGSSVEDAGTEVARRFPEPFPTTWAAKEFVRRLFGLVSR